MNNEKAYALLVGATKAIYLATNRSWDNLSELEQGERINATRQGFAVILDSYETSGYGLRTQYMRALVEATAAPAALDPEDALTEAQNFFSEIANGGGRSITAEAASRILAGLNEVELAD